MNNEELTEDEEKDLVSQSPSPEARAAQKKLLALACSEKPEDHVTLHRHLTDESFLEILDSEDAYEGPVRELRLARILKALIDNPSTPARESLLLITKSQIYLSHIARVSLLIDVWAEARPAPPDAVRFWDEHCQPDDAFSHRTIKMLVHNRSGPALELLGKKLATGAHEDQYKIYWMRSFMIEARNDPTMLEICERLITGTLSENLKPYLVEILFDYRPREWYRSVAPPNVPVRAQAPRESLLRLQTIGRYALKHVALTKTQREAAEKCLEEIDRLLSRSKS